MDRKILYIQENENVAESFKLKFAERELDFVIAKSASEAFEIMRQEDILILLVDINIPDMRLHELVEICRRDFPGVIIDVCVDIVNATMITKLVNRHGIEKIFPAPWDVNEIVDEIEDSLDTAYIKLDSNIRENEIKKNRADLEQTVRSLKETLKRQKHSYYKFNLIMETLYSAIGDMGGNANDPDGRYDFCHEVFKRMLRMQTTTSLDAENFDNIVREDLKDIKNDRCDFSVGEVVALVIGQSSRFKLENIRFMIWLLAKFNAGYYSPLSLDVGSHFITANRTEFNLYFKGEKRAEISEDIASFVHDLVSELSEDIERQETDEGIEYRIGVLTAVD